MYEHASFLADDGWRAAKAATALHRQEEDGGPVDAVGAATDEAVGRHRLLDMEGGRLLDGAAQDREDGREAEQSAAIRIMRMTLAAGPALAFMTFALDGGGRFLVDVLMNRSVAMDVNMDLRGFNLSDFVKAVGGAVRECNRDGRQNDARNVDQRDKARDAASY
jgi:hypothetical protein